MAATAPGRIDVAELDQLIVRALVTLRAARADCRTSPTRRNLERLDRAEDNLDALLDCWSAAHGRPSADAPPADVAAADRLPA